MIAIEIKKSQVCTSTQNCSEQIQLKTNKSEKEKKIQNKNKGKIKKKKGDNMTVNLKSKNKEEYEKQNKWKLNNLFSQNCSLFSSFSLFLQLNYEANSRFKPLIIVH